MSTAQIELPSAERGAAAVRHIRGSSLLLSGRGISLAAKFVSQLLVVRYLSTGDYGAWAYALSMVALLRGISALSLDRAVARFASIYHQRGEFERFFGTLALAAGAISATGLVFVSVVYAAPGLFLRLVGGEAQPVALLAIAVFLVPLEAIDQLMVTVFATLEKARAIFMRQYVLTPLLQLTVVLLMIASGAGVEFLALGYIAGTALGVAIYGTLLLRLMHRQGLFGRAHGISVPFVEIFAFSTPLMASDWLAGLIQASGALTLGFFHDTDAIAAFRVVVPVAVLNQLVIQSFSFLYVPGASRLFAKGDHEEINDLYWRTALWIAVLSFPVFALTFTAGGPLTVFFFGERYASSGLLLSILAVGNYAQACLGFNGSTLKVYGRVSWAVAVTLLAAVVNVVLSVLLVPRFGALGAALAMSGTLVMHNVFKQAGLHLATGVRPPRRDQARPFAVIAAAAAALLLVRVAAAGHPVILLGTAGLVSLAVLRLTRRDLRVERVFPELLRVPLLRAVLT
jgi:O-antigen/teichoic acid export membrane protein